MDKPLCIHVGLHPPSNYPQLTRSLFSESKNNCGNNYKGNLTGNNGCVTGNQENKKFNITIGKFNPNTVKFNPLSHTSSLKSPYLNVSTSKSSDDFAQESNFDNLTSLSSYDFSKFGSNSTSKSFISNSSSEKSVRFSNDKFPSNDSLKVDDLTVVDGCDLTKRSLNQQGLTNLESYNESTNLISTQNTNTDNNRNNNNNEKEKSGDLINVFRKVVKHVINVNRFKNTGSDFMNELLGVDSEGIENVGFSDELKNNLSLNQADSFGNEPLLNKGSTTSLCESQINSLNKKNRNDLNVTYNKKWTKINDKHKMIQKLLDELDDPLKLLSNDAPLNNILDEHINITRLVHPFYINYYPLRVEIEDEEEEYGSERKPDPSPIRKRISRPEDYPALWAIYTNPKNGITTVL